RVTVGRASIRYSGFDGIHARRFIDRDPLDGPNAPDLNVRRNRWKAEKRSETNDHSADHRRWRRVPGPTSPPIGVGSGSGSLSAGGEGGGCVPLSAGGEGGGCGPLSAGGEGSVSGALSAGGGGSSSGPPSAAGARIGPGALAAALDVECFQNF